ncbi:MAG: DUF3276 family protein [Paludibacteraceae bacterium]|nr:DUF3276 family protein [Paludibacteraceae bacterium]
MEMENRRFDDRREPEIVFSRSVKAGKRIYYLDVKKARNEDLYLCITESKKKSGEEEVPTFEKHKVFLYKEDFKHFTEALNDVIGYVEQKFGTIEERQAWVPEEVPAEEEPAEETSQAEEEPKRRGLFSRFVKKD